MFMDNEHLILMQTCHSYMANVYIPEWLLTGHPRNTMWLKQVIFQGNLIFNSYTLNSLFCFVLPWAAKSPICVQHDLKINNFLTWTGCVSMPGFQRGKIHRKRLISSNKYQPQEGNVLFLPPFGTQVAIFVGKVASWRRFFLHHTPQKNPPSHRGKRNRFKSPIPRVKLPLAMA